MLFNLKTTRQTNAKSLKLSFPNTLGFKICSLKRQMQVQFCTKCSLNSTQNSVKHKLKLKSKQTKCAQTTHQKHAHFIGPIGKRVIKASRVIFPKLCKPPFACFLFAHTAKTPKNITQNQKLKPTPPNKGRRFLFSLFL